MSFMKTVAELEEEQKELVSMLDGAYEVVELFGWNGSPSQKIWAQEWCRRAREFGAISDCMW